MPIPFILVIVVLVIGVVVSGTKSSHVQEKDPKEGGSEKPKEEPPSPGKPGEKPDPKPDPKPDDPQPDPIPDPQPDPKPDPAPDPKPEDPPKPDPKPDPKPEIPIPVPPQPEDPKPDPKPDPPKPDPEPEPAPDPVGQLVWIHTGETDKCHQAPLKSLPANMHYYASEQSCVNDPFVWVYEQGNWCQKPIPKSLSDSAEGHKYQNKAVCLNSNVWYTVQNNLSTGWQDTCKSSTGQRPAEAYDSLGACVAANTGYTTQNDCNSWLYKRQIDGTVYPTQEECKQHLSNVWITDDLCTKPVKSINYPNSRHYATQPDCRRHLVWKCNQATNKCEQVDSQTNVTQAGYPTEEGCLATGCEHVGTIWVEQLGYCRSVPDTMQMRATWNPHYATYEECEAGLRKTPHSAWICDHALGKCTYQRVSLDVFRSKLDPSGWPITELVCNRAGCAQTKAPERNYWVPSGGVCYERPESQTVAGNRFDSQAACEAFITPTNPPSTRKPEQMPAQAIRAQVCGTGPTNTGEWCKTSVASACPLHTRSVLIHNQTKYCEYT